MALDDKAEAEKTAADQFDRRKKDKRPSQSTQCTIQVEQLTDEKKKNEKNLEEMDKMIKDLCRKKKDHAKTQLIKGKYKKDIAEITVRAETIEKNIQMAEQEKVKTVRDYKAASEELMRTNTELDYKQD
ncbi:hypothetical protein EIN_028600 [Entamoeba invadens IP1]|uniref:Uncharacterized protein n=1 Tax=Entamoeba invadens IP1 TaxID=370355 RepID=L7FLM2_ENTIV|nr:hypothetical protein EIN_028600 [Entamoeba invadens IP1]ELP87075.1 hypothetical protein EIN_028600 [Entamoeba invadens IP1]|eukprot:XP_004253846.1 hypothetical protein EIN_028600 [Entamoeba invadens IP1]